MKAIKSSLFIGALLLTTAGFAQTTPANAPRPANQQVAEPTPTQAEAGQQNSETFTKTEAEKAFNPQNTPVVAGTVIRDTIVPGRSGQGSQQMQKNPYKKDTMKVLGGKGSSEDTTKAKSSKKRKNQ